MRISLIVAADNENCIGRGGDLPWYLPSDLKWFKQVTAGHTCIAGRVTEDSIEKRLGKPLPNRTTIVVTHKHKANQVGVIHATYPEQAIAQAMYAEKRRNPDGNPPRELFIIGGVQIYKLFLPFADDDPKSAEVLSKVLLLARDEEIKDPTILEQLLRN